MYPWAVVYRDYLAKPQGGSVIFWSMLCFVGILTVGYIYAIKKGALDWSGEKRENRKVAAENGIPPIGGTGFPAFSLFPCRPGC